jgi:pimeloyl-ACP methyl ester carboxylesterase
VVGAVLLNGAGPFSSNTPDPNPVQKTIETVVRSILLQPLPSWLLFQYVRQRSVIRQTLEKVYLDHTAITDQLVEEIYRPSCDPGAATVFASVFKFRQGEPVDALLSQMKCPLLMLWGVGDPWINVSDRGAKFRQHYPALTDYYLQAGHCPHDEVPDQVNELLTEWVLNQV